MRMCFVRNAECTIYCADFLSEYFVRLSCDIGLRLCVGEWRYFCGGSCRAKTWFRARLLNLVASFKMLSLECSSRCESICIIWHLCCR